MIKGHFVNRFGKIYQQKQQKMSPISRDLTHFTTLYTLDREKQ